MIKLTTDNNQSIELTNLQALLAIALVNNKVRMSGINPNCFRLARLRRKLAEKFSFADETYLKNAQELLGSTYKELKEAGVVETNVDRVVYNDKLMRFSAMAEDFKIDGVYLEEVDIQGFFDGFKAKMEEPHVIIMATALVM